MNESFNKLTFFVILLLLSISSVSAQISSGGAYKIEQSVIANGGGAVKDEANIIAVESSTAQSVAGRLSSGGAFTVTSGFFTPMAFAPTASTVSVSGRVITNNGKGIRGATISITDSFGIVRTTKSGVRGNFYFSDILAGKTYIFNAKARRFEFNQNNQSFNITADLTDIVFIAEDINSFK